MAENVLERLFEHNNWANRRVLEACAALTDAQLDAAPQTATRGSIRETLTHLATAQRGYLALLTLPVDERPSEPLAWAGVAASLEASGTGLAALARDLSGGPLGKGHGAGSDATASSPPAARLRTRDGHDVEPWVVIVQVVNHATEHREQVKSMLTALGITPPDIDGWSHGLATGALAMTAG